MVEPPSPPYIPAKHHGGNQATLKRIVLHSTVSDTYRGAARDIARYFQNPSYVSSAHYAVDPGEVIQMVYDHTIAWHDGTNEQSIGIEMCEHPSRDVGRWNTDEHQALLARTASLVRQLCLAYEIPLRRITADQIRAGESGICGHDDMAEAYPSRTSHWDPGAFPWNEFMALVDGAPITEEDDMRMTDPVPVPSQAEQGTVGYALHNLLYGVDGKRRDGDIASALRHIQWRVDSMPALIAKQGGVSADELAEALRPVIAETVGPVIENAVADALGNDDAETAQAIVDALAQRLAGGRDE